LGEWEASAHPGELHPGAHLLRQRQHPSRNLRGALTPRPGADVPTRVGRHGEQGGVRHLRVGPLGAEVQRDSSKHAATVEESSGT